MSIYVITVYFSFVLLDDFGAIHITQMLILVAIIAFPTLRVCVGGIFYEHDVLDVSCESGSSIV